MRGRNHQPVVSPVALAGVVSAIMVALGLLCAAPGVAAPAKFTVGTSAGGRVVLAGVDLSRRPVGALVNRLGEPLVSPDRSNSGCTFRWPELGLRVRTANYGGLDACSPEGGLVQYATMTSRVWKTGRGLRVGDPMRRLRALYPSARKRFGWWSLVTAYSAIGDGGYYPRLGARGTRAVRQLLVQPLAAGD